MENGRRRDGRDRRALALPFSFFPLPFPRAR
jgi:hypothetical protein